MLKQLVANYTQDIRCPLYGASKRILSFLSLLDPNKCCPRMATLAERLNIDLSTVKRAIRKLKKMGYLTIKKWWKLNHYTIEAKSLIYHDFCDALPDYPPDTPPDNIKTINIINKRQLEASPLADETYIFSEQEKQIAQERGLDLKTVYLKFKAWWGIKISRLKDIRGRFLKWLLAEKIQIVHKPIIGGSMARLPWIEEVRAEQEKHRSKPKTPEEAAQHRDSAEEVIRELRKFVLKNKGVIVHE